MKDYNEHMLDMEMDQRDRADLPKVEDLEDDRWDDYDD